TLPSMTRIMVVAAGAFLHPIPKAVAAMAAAARVRPEEPITMAAHRRRPTFPLLGAATVNGTIAGTKSRTRVRQRAVAQVTTSRAERQRRWTRLPCPRRLSWYPRGQGVVDARVVIAVAPRSWDASWRGCEPPSLPPRNT